MIEWTAATFLVIIGIAHSGLGETQVIRPPLSNRGWRLPAISRAAADPLLRFAWHLTNVAGWALAAVLLTYAVIVVTETLQAGPAVALVLGA